MPQSANKTSSKRTAAIRQCQAERRKRQQIKTLTIEVDKETHGKIKKLADHKQITMQGLLSNALKSMVDTDMNSRLSRPWSVFENLREEQECDRTHVSLFSGCGGIDLGFRQAGFKTVFANDIDVGACMTYRANLGEIVEGDVRTAGLPNITYRRRVPLPAILERRL